VVFKLKNQQYYKVNAAVKFCNDILLNEQGLSYEFYRRIREKHFDMSTAEGAHIAAKIEQFVGSLQHINVKFYKSRNPWSKAYGYHTKARPFDVNINTRRMNRTTGSFVATLVHELVHAVDGLDFVHDYGHGSNSSENKENTAPYWIGNLASEMYGDEQTVESYPKVVRLSWFERLWSWLF